MADNVEVKLGADAGPAKAGMEDAARSIQASLQGIQKALENFSTTNKKARDDAIKNNADLSRTFLELKASAEGGFNGIIGVIERFRGVWISLAGLLAGGMLWKAAIDQVLEMNESVRKLQITFGMLSDQATTTAVALKIIGKSGDDFSAMGMKLARQLKMDEQGIKDLGVQTRDTATGALLPLDVIMQNGFKTMQDYRAGADQDIVALKLFGRNVGDVVETMLMMPAALQRAKDLQKELGIEWGPDKQAQVKAYQLEVGAFQVVLGHIGEEIGMAVMPQLMTLAKYFNDVGPSAAEFIIKAVKLVIATIDALATGAKEDYLIVKGTWDNLVVAASALWAGMKDAFETGGTNISNIWADMNKRILKNTLETNAAVLGLEHDLILRLNALDETHTSKPGAIPGFGSGGKSAPTGKPTGPASEVADWDKALKAAQDYYNDLKDAQGSFERWSESMTRDYWQEVLDNFKLSADDRAALDHKMHEANNVVRKQEFDAEIANLDKIAAGYKFNYAERIRLAEQAAAIVADKYGFESAEYARASAKIIALQQQQEAQEQRLADLARKRIETIANFEYQTKLNGLNQQLALRQINVQQELALEQQYLDEKLAIDIKAINDEIAAAGPEGDPVKLQALNDKKLQLELQYQTAKTAIANKAEQDRMQYVLQAEQAVENTFSTMLSDLMNRTKSWKDVMLDAVASITKALNDLVAKKLAQQIFGAGTGGNDILGSIFGSLFGAGGGSAAAAGSALDNPFLSIFGGIASYDVGTPYVPRDTLALVHRGEAIIPAAQNKGRPGGSPLAVTNHFHITGPVDSRTQDQIAAAAARATQRAMYRTL